MKKYSDISDYERLKLHKKIWAEKEVLRIIYNDYYEKILNYFSKKK